MGIALAVGFILSFVFTSCQSRQEVVLYTSQDQHYVEPILDDFQKQTGIRVRAVFDSEAVKTVGLANRLIAEASNPQCDVWWSNEELRTRQLAGRGLFRGTNWWAAFGFRSRRVVVNTNQLALSDAPRSLLELTNAQWRGKVALAYPMFGTTSMHFLALRESWGEAGWDQWMRALVANQPFFVDGNSIVVSLVGRGEATVGLTDSDDIAAGQRNGLPVDAQPLGSDAFLIRNTVGVVRGAPHPREAEVLFEYLQQPEVMNRLIAVGALEGNDGDATTKLEVRWDAVLQNLESVTARMKEIVLR